MKEVKRILLHSSFMPFINYQLPFIEHQQLLCPLHPNNSDLTTIYYINLELRKASHTAIQWQSQVYIQPGLSLEPTQLLLHHAALYPILPIGP